MLDKHNEVEKEWHNKRSKRQIKPQNLRDSSLRSI